MVIGVDEVGRGALAGPLVACALRIRDTKKFPRAFVRDSKKLSPHERHRLYPLLTASCELYFGVASSILIDRIGVQAANVFAVDLALGQFKAPRNVCADYIGGFERYTLRPGLVKLFARGEDVFPEIAAASIAAKVFRDTLMVALAQEDSRYGFERHKGYGTAHHIQRLFRYGASRIHRASYVQALQTR